MQQVFYGEGEVDREEGGAALDDVGEPVVAHKLAGCVAELRLFFEALQQEVFALLGYLGEWGVVVLYNTEECRVLH